MLLCLFHLAIFMNPFNKNVCSLSKSIQKMLENCHPLVETTQRWTQKYMTLPFGINGIINESNRGCIQVVI